MPRVKQSNPKQVVVKQTSVDVEPAVAEDPIFAAGVVEETVTEAAPPVGPKKKARVAKVKPCVRCEERRARERKYAKSSRLRLRLAAAAAAPPTTPHDSSAPAVAAAPPAEGATMAPAV